jgi:two-component system, NarL family, invasion response regulator UvrY
MREPFPPSRNAERAGSAPQPIHADPGRRNPTMPPRILIVDDHAIVRAGLRQLIADEVNLEATGDASTGAEAIAQVRANDWDLVLLDINLPDRNGLEVLKQIKQEKPGLAVLIMSMHPEDRFAVQFLRSGASGYMAKNASPADMVKAIQTVLSGHKYISATVAELLAGELDTNSEKPLHGTLSEREYEIFRKLAGGRTVSGIAAELCISVKTVSTYRARILEKMNMRHNAELTYYAVKNDLIE